MLMAAIKPVVLSGPSGSGKSTIFERARREYPAAFAFSVSHTTRKPRPTEENGVHYWFVDHDQMQKMINNGDFLEYATFGGNIYGTSKKAVEDVQRTGRICVLDLELQGVRNIKSSHLDARFILIRAPTLEILEERLKRRGTETEDSILKRIEHAREDLRAVDSDPSLFDYIITNDDLERAYNEFLSILSKDLSTVGSGQQNNV